MLNHSTSILLGIAFVLIGAANVWLILQASARVRDAKASTRLIAAHRIGGYLFIALFCGMGYVMVGRLGAVDGSAPAGTTIHLALAMVLSPLLFVKVLVARYYKSYSSFLMPIGLMIFVLSFVLIGITLAPDLANPARLQTVSLDAIDLPPTVIDMSRAAATMEKRCSKCHNLDRIAGARKDARGWLTTVNRMQALPDSGIPEEDSRIIVSYLASRASTRGQTAAAGLEVARALVDGRCGRCHSLDRVYKTAATPEEWSATVTRMANYAEGSSGAFQPGEERQIIDYLSATQTPDAANQRKAQATAVPGAGRIEEKPAGSSSPDRPAARSPYNKTVVAFISLVCFGLLVLIIRRPKHAPPAEVARNPVVRTAGQPPGNPLILRLASIVRQTPDATTLRFIVADGQSLRARPGQFLSFSFLFDGRKTVRAYSICSSPARSGYVEITPKRVRQGCVSVFLNDRAAVGMTVEAKGPFGSFYFDESQHENVVLLAAGSGITPMMAMLRYMDDLCLETPVTLLYCVRTADDVIFHHELGKLQRRLKNLQYHLLLSQPHEEWSGPRGHVSREFLESSCHRIDLQDFFICGPPSFMDASRAILMEMGVKPERIRQESFGAAAGNHIQAGGDERDMKVEFGRSGKMHALRSGQTLLEAAEECGVSIPSSCRHGQCGTCKTRLLSGNLRMDTEEGLDPESRARGYVLTCVGHADGDVTLDA